MEMKLKMKLQENVVLIPRIKPYKLQGKIGTEVGTNGQNSETRLVHGETSFNDKMTFQLNRESVGY